MDVQILRMTTANAAKLQQVDDEIFDDEIHADHLAAYLADAGHLMVCAFAGGVAIGQARGILNRQPDTATSLYIDNLGVAPSRRREGIAGRLLDELVAWGRENGCASAWVATELDNEGARALYAARGAPGEAVAYYACDLAAA